MNTTSNKYINVAYELFSDFDGKNEMVEKATAEHPFHFISDVFQVYKVHSANVAWTRLYLPSMANSIQTISIREP